MGINLEPLTHIWTFSWTRFSFMNIYMTIYMSLHIFSIICISMVWWIGYSFYYDNDYWLTLYANILFHVTVSFLIDCNLGCLEFFIMQSCKFWSIVFIPPNCQLFYLACFWLAIASLKNLTVGSLIFRILSKVWTEKY